MTRAKDDGFAVVVDDALGDESMKVRSTIDDGEWKVFKMVAEGFFGAVPERVGGWSARCEWIERFDVRGGVVDWREGMSVLVCVAGCYHVEGRLFVIAGERHLAGRPDRCVREKCGCPLQRARTTPPFVTV